MSENLKRVTYWSYHFLQSLLMCSFFAL